jgi:hypothetical protein
MLEFFSAPPLRSLRLCGEFTLISAIALPKVQKWHKKPLAPSLYHPCGWGHSLLTIVKPHRAALKATNTNQTNTNQ